jgi:hypothetical protein
LEDKGLSPKIPSCRKISDKSQLTTVEANESRLVTKCRFIIEKRMGDIKKYNALFDRRNTEVGHLQIDYRNVCAMLNFLHKPCHADINRDPAKIAKKIRDRFQIQTNDLTKLFKIQFDTNAVPLQNLSEFIDFPRLSEDEMIENIFFGSFYIKQSQMYMSDLLRVGKASYISREVCASQKYEIKSPNSKIIGFELPSRHMRGKKNTESDRYIQSFRDHHKIFVEYIPGQNAPESIIGYACTCKSGRKQVGCCIHSAVLIYYLSNSKYKEIHLPGEHLMSILVDMNRKDLPNQPRYVRHKRRTVLIPINLHHPDDWTDLELRNYVRINSEKFINWFNENYISESFTPRSFDENNIAQHYFNFDQQIVLGLEIVRIMQGSVNTHDDRIYRFLTTRMFMQIMNEIVTSTYNCNVVEMKQYMDYVAEHTRRSDSPNDYYLQTIKTQHLIRMNEWLIQHR